MRVPGLSQLVVLILHSTDAFNSTPFSHCRTSFSSSVSSYVSSLASQPSATAIDEEVTDINPIEEEEEDPASRKEIVVTASIVLPFKADVAFDAFSDLSRQPSWSSWLNSVSYISDNDNDNGSNDNDDDIIAIAKEEQEKRKSYINTDTNEIDVSQLRQTKWVMGWKKIRFSWKSKVTYMQRPKCIHWESTSGLKNMGTILFEEKEIKLDEKSNEKSTAVDDDNSPTTTDVNTQMTLTLKFIAPRIVASIMRRSDRIATFMKSQILRPTLRKFRDIVMVDDLGMDSITPDVDIE